MSQSMWLVGGDELELPVQPPGCVLTVLRGHEVIVWLIGEVDDSLDPDLRDIAEQTSAFVSRLVIDGSRVTFCDSAVVRFIAGVAAAVPVTIRRPSRVFADIIELSGLAQNPWIHAEPASDR
jgi:anti-anti-sigma regulatory factor